MVKKTPQRQNSHIPQAALVARADQAEIAAARVPSPLPRSFVSRGGAEIVGMPSQSPTPAAASTSTAPKSKVGSASSESVFEALIADIKSGKGGKAVIAEAKARLEIWPANAKREGLQRVEAAEEQGRQARAKAHPNKVQKGFNWKKKASGKGEDKKPSGGRPGPGGSKNFN